MYVATASKEIQFHEIFNLNLVYNYQPVPRNGIGPCRSVSWSKDGGWLTVVPHSGYTEIISVKNNSCKLIQTIHDINEPACASFSNLTKRTIAVGTKYGRVLLYDIKLRSVKYRFTGKTTPVLSVGYTAKDTHCYVGYENGEICLYSNITKKLVSTMKIPHGDHLTALQAHVQKRNYLIGGNSDGIVAVWDTNLTNKTMKFSKRAHDAPVTAVTFSPINTTLILSAGSDRQVCVYDIDNQQRISCIPLENSVTALDFTPDSIYILMGSQDGKIHLYDTRKLEKAVNTYQAHQSTIRHLAVQKTCQSVVNSNSTGSSVASTDNEPSISPATVAPTIKIVAAAEEEQSAENSNLFQNLMADSSVPADALCLSSIKQHPNDGNELKLKENNDSFLQALGLNETNNNTNVSTDLKDTNKCAEKDDRQQQERHLSFNSGSTMSPFTLNEKRSLCQSTLLKNFASTPKTTVPDVSTTVTLSTIPSTSLTSPEVVKSTINLTIPTVATISPIISQSNNNQINTESTMSSIYITHIKPKIDELMSTLAADKKQIGDEYKQIIDKLSFDLRYEMYVSNQELRNLMLNIYFDLNEKICDVKKYSEEISEKLMSNNTNTNSGNNRGYYLNQQHMQQFFLEENRQLRMKVAELEKELAELMITSSSSKRV